AVLALHPPKSAFAMLVLDRLSLHCNNINRRSLPEGRWCVRLRLGFLILLPQSLTMCFSVVAVANQWIVASQLQQHIDGQPFAQSRVAIGAKGCPSVRPTLPDSSISKARIPYNH
ncbi:MAG: hypothetical protein ACKPKO_11935, partial [Candidatus Fonsibacter sp.]